MSLIIEQPERFRQFDVVSDHSDHSYLNYWNKPTKSKKGISTTNNNNNANDAKTDGPDWFANPSSGVHKKIIKEWRVLERNLPEDIYVRVYERRIDLLRAAIVGPAGTPYHDGVFVFDVAFPPDYPARPPLVHYRSFGIRINPNLYANGKVCLSLLNTWFGSRNEKWNPGESTMLQILVSIQGLVLNNNPYFNEPGAGLFTGRKTKKSMAYTENTFIYSCMTMVYLLKKPPKNFETFISTHFRDRSTHILSACDAYMNSRAVVGCYGETSSDQVFKVSKNFKALMKSWYPHMVVVFKGTGASLGSFEQLMVEKKTTSSKGNYSDVKKKQKKEKSSGFWKLLGIVKGFLGFKKVGTEKEIKVNSSSS
ncbi:hypothetical protein C3L33_12994, partial [Rhododendron williamsianum]